MCAYKGCSRLFLAMSFALLASLAGCGGGGGDETGSGGGGSGPPGPPGPPPETTVPTVTSMSPGEDSGIAADTGIGTNSKLTATLSEAMDPALITLIDPVTGKPANFRLAQGDTAIAGTASYDATNHIAIFTPAVVLAPNTKYTATIITGIKDLAGNPLTTDFAWCFTTDAIPDVTPPSVMFTIPANTVPVVVGVAVNRKITATFSEDMNSSTLTPASFTVTGPGPTPVSGTVTYSRRMAVFTPSTGLAPNTAYTATIGTGAMDLAGNPLQAANAIWSFTTGAGADVTAPVVNVTFPASAATNVAISTAITVTFNEPMDPATITTANFAVTGPGTDLVVGTVAFDASNNTATFTRIKHLITPVDFHPTPVSNLDPVPIYTATLTTGARDLAGNALASNRVWSFTTAP